MTGRDVTWVQEQLDRTGAHLVTDGVFGSATKHAVIAFQRRHGLKSDGVVGARTWRSLARSGAASAAVDVAQIRSLLDALRQQLELDDYSRCLYISHAGGADDCDSLYPDAAQRAARWAAQADSFFNAIPIIPGAVSDAKGCFLHGSAVGCVNTVLNVMVLVPGVDIADVAGRALTHEAEGILERAAADGISKAEGGDSLGAMKRLRFEASPKHPDLPGLNGQEALDFSLQVSENSARRIGIDYSTDRFVVLDETYPGQGMVTSPGVV